MTDPEDQARRRFVALNLVRLLAIAMVFAGAANVGGRLLPELSPVLGYVLLVAGALDFFLAPAILKRGWRSPDR